MWLSYIVLTLYYVIWSILVQKLYHFLELYNAYIHFFSSFTKRWKILQDNVSSLILKSLSQPCQESCIEIVKEIKFQAPQIRDSLLQLAKTSEDTKIKSEVDCLATYEIEIFELLLGMTIWYDILFTVNPVIKKLQ